MRCLKRTAFLAGILFILWMSVSYADRINNAGGVAIKGYDAVAYFTENQAVAGNSQYSYQWMDVTWYFATAENLKKFKKDPVKYAPQYGGFCAYAVSKGSVADTDPTAWSVVNGKLYLNFNSSVKTLWECNKTGFIQQANANWGRLK